MLLQFVLVRRAKSYNEIELSSVEYSDNCRMMDGPVANSGRKGVRFIVQNEPKDSGIEGLCLQVESFHLMVTKQPPSARQSEPECCKSNKRGHYASTCGSRQESTICRCNKKGHYASECPIKPDPLISCASCHRKGHKAEGCFVGRRNEAG